MPDGGKATQELAAVALASGKTNADAAAAAGVCEKTINNWKRESEFRELVAELRRAATDRALGTLADGMNEAATELRELLSSDKEAIRLRAAVAILELGLKGIENAEIRKELDELQKAIEEGQRT